MNILTVLLFSVGHYLSVIQKIQKCSFVLHTLRVEKAVELINVFFRLFSFYTVLTCTRIIVSSVPLQCCLYQVYFFHNCFLSTSHNFLCLSWYIDQSSNECLLRCFTYATSITCILLFQMHRYEFCIKHMNRQSYIQCGTFSSQRCCVVFRIFCSALDFDQP